MPDTGSTLTRPDFSVVIPAYNSDSSLTELTERLAQVFSEQMKESYEIIIIDDGSRNRATWSTIQQLAQQPQVTGIRLTRNYGKPGAVVCGLSHARGRWIVTLDDDLQQVPEDIPLLAQQRSHDVVVGAISEKRHSLFVRLSSRAKGWFDRVILGVPCPMSPLKLITADVVQDMLDTATSRPFIPALLCGVTTDIVSVPIRHEHSRMPSSRYSFFKRLSQFSNLLIGNSSLLLRCIGAIGTLAALSGFLFALFTVFRVILGAEVLPGWASLIVINLTFGGLILIALGINGEYLIRILEHSSNRPAYRVRTIVRSTDSQKA